MSGAKPQALPRAALDLGDKVSKSDLLEVAYHLASYLRDDGPDAEASTLRRLEEQLDALRKDRGIPPLREEWASARRAELDRKDAALLRYLAKCGDRGATRAEIVDDLSARCGGRQAIDATIIRLLKARRIRLDKEQRDAPALGRKVGVYRPAAEEGAPK